MQLFPQHVSHLRPSYKWLRHPSEDRWNIIITTHSTCSVKGGTVWRVAPVRWGLEQLYSARRMDKRTDTAWIPNKSRSTIAVDLTVKAAGRSRKNFTRRRIYPSASSLTLPFQLILTNSILSLKMRHWFGRLSGLWAVQCTNILKPLPPTTTSYAASPIPPGLDAASYCQSLSCRPFPSQRTYIPNVSWYQRLRALLDRLLLCVLPTAVHIVIICVLLPHKAQMDWTALNCICLYHITPGSSLYHVWRCLAISFKNFYFILIIFCCFQVWPPPLWRWRILRSCPTRIEPTPGQLVFTG